LHSAGPKKRHYPSRTGPGWPADRHRPPRDGFPQAFGTIRQLGRRRPAHRAGRHRRAAPAQARLRPSTYALGHAFLQPSEAASLIAEDAIELGFEGFVEDMGEQACGLMAHGDARVQDRSRIGAMDRARDALEILQRPGENRLPARLADKKFGDTGDGLRHGKRGYMHRIIRLT